MTELLALSVDVATSPRFRLRAIDDEDRHAQRGAQPLGWGFAWYPGSGSAAMVVKDPTSIGRNALTKVLSDWERFQSTVFVAHLRGAAKRTKQADTHPFQRAHGGRDWVLTHNGDLRHGFRSALAIDPAHDVHTPIGRTDSEHVLCWLLNQVKARGGRSIADIEPDAWLAWLRSINALGTSNFVLTDGRDLVAYSDAFDYRPLHWVRHTPPNPTIRFEGPEVRLQLGSARDTNRTTVVVSTTPLSDDAGWCTFEPGQMLLARRGYVQWLSAASEGPLEAPGGAGQEELELEAGAGEAAELGALAPAAPPLAEPNPPSAPQRRATLPTEAALERAAESLAAPEVFTAALSREEGEDFGEEHAVDGAHRILTTLHETVYTYEDAVRHSSHLFRLRPEIDDGQELLEHELILSPSTPSRRFRDVFGNYTHETVIREPYNELRLLAKSTVRVRNTARPKLRTIGMPQRIPLVWMPWQRQMMTPYLLSPELPESQLRELSQYAMSFVERQDYDLVETLKDINRTIFRDYEYVPSSTQLATTPFWVYAERKGVCQDFANLFIALCRLLDVPARYRVGYIYTGGKYDARQGDASHAWAEVYIPFIGWRGFDPTNGILAGRDHVRVACGRNYRDATPTSGTLYDGGGGESLTVTVKVVDPAESE